MFFCPGTAREALLWREPCNSVVGRHRSHSVWTADASWFSTSDTPTGSRQEGQVMHVGVVPSAQPQNCWLQRAVLSGSPPAELTDVYFLRVLPIRRTTTAFLWTFTWILILYEGFPGTCTKSKNPHIIIFFVPVWKLIFLMCDTCITNHTVTCSALEYWVEMNIFINKMEVEQMRALKYHIFCAEEQPSHNHAKFTLKNWEWLESQLIWVWHHLVVLLGIAPEKTARPENWGSVFCRLVQTSCSWICYLTMPTKARKLTQRYANDQLQ